jgi:protein tyrosine phosphatase (PTP) superfamily phosphohydrolase (DUF442 family)
VVDPNGIFMWRRIDARLTTSGQPTEEQLAALLQLGVTHVVNLGLHSHEKALADEGASLAALGIGYTHIPVDWEAPAEPDFVAFRAAMGALEGATIHVHCIANMRVSAFLYRYHREVGLSEPEAREMLERVWRPGGVWARFIGHDAAAGLPHRVAGRDY